MLTIEHSPSVCSTILVKRMEVEKGLSTFYTRFSVRNMSLSRDCSKHLKIAVINCLTHVEDYSFHCSMLMEYNTWYNPSSSGTCTDLCIGILQIHPSEQTRTT